MWSGKSDTNGLVLQQQRNDHAIRQNHFCAMTTRLFRSIEICYSYNATRSPGPSSIRRKGTSGEIQEVQQSQVRVIAQGIDKKKITREETFSSRYSRISTSTEFILFCGLSIKSRQPCVEWLAPPDEISSVCPEIIGTSAP